MAAYEVLLLNTSIPQIQAAQAGDTYVVPRDIAFSAATTFSLGSANGLLYLDGSKNAVTSSNLTFNGTTLSANALTLATPLAATSGGTGFASYTAGDLLYASSTTALAKLTIGASTYILTSNGSAPSWAAPSSISVNTATNLAGGAAGSVPYQSGASTTTFLSIGTANQVMQVNAGATAPEWVSTSGTGNVARVTSPTFVTPTLGAATATSVNKVTITAPATAATLTIADGKTLTVNSTLTFTGTDATTMTFPASTTTLAGLSISQTFSAAQTFSDAVTMSATTQNIALGTSQTSGTFTVGGTSQTGTQTFDQSTKTHTLNIGSGATENAATKTVNIAANGVSGSTTTITVGSANGTSTTIRGSSTFARSSAQTNTATDFVVVQHTSSATVAAGFGAGIQFRGSNPGGGDSTYGSIQGVWEGALSNPSGGALLFLTDGFTGDNTERMRITSEGRVGIGTNAPTATLDVAGSVAASGSVTLSGGTANGVLYLNGSKVATSGSALTFDGTKLVNTSVVAGALIQSVDSGGTGSFVRMLGDANSGNLINWTTSTALRFATSADNFTSYSEIARLTSTGLKSSIAGSNSDPVFSYTSDTNTGIFFPAADKLGFVAGGGSDQMVLTTTGLGIGTNAPNMRLHVAGAQTTSGDSRRIIYAQDTTSFAQNVGGGIAFAGFFNSANVAAATYASIAGLKENGTDGQQQGYLSFVTNSGSSQVERAVINSSGNLGLGVTPNTWSGTFKALQFGGGIVGSIVASGDSTYLASNWFYDGAEKYVTNGFASFYRQNAGKHIWYNAANNTSGAGAPLTPTQAMTLDASGNLLVGKTSSTYNSAGRGVFELNGSTESILALQYNSANGYFLQVNSGAAYLWNSGNTPLIFGTNNTERARITSGGNLLVGTATGVSASAHNIWTGDSSVTTLYVRNTNNSTPNGIVINYSAAAPNGTANEFLYCQDNGALRASIRSNGGLANYQSNNVDLSDIRTKTDINPLGSYWNKIAGLEIVTYKYKDQTHDDLNIGVIAQQVEQIAPEFVDADGWDKVPEDGVPLKTIYNKDLTFAAIKALQEAMTRIEQLEAKVASLESKGA